MRFWSNGPRSAAVGHEFLKVGGDFGEQRCGQARGHRDDAGEDARQQTAQVTEGDGAIDPPRRIGREVLLGGQIRGQSIEVVADHLAPVYWQAASQVRPEVCSRFRRCLTRLNASSIRQRW